MAKVVIEDSAAVCTDCVMFAEYGEQAETDPNYNRARAARFLSPLSGGRRDFDCVTDEGSFSWLPCDCCGDTLGGQRYSVLVIRHG